MEEQDVHGAESPPQHLQIKLFRPRRRLRLGAVIVVAAAVGLLVWAVIGDGANDSLSPTVTSTTASTGPAATPVGPIGMSAQGLQNLARSVSQPIYWAGPKPGYLYELTRTNTGNVFVRYLPPGAKVGSKQGVYLIIATYPFPNAFNALNNVKGGRRLTIPRGGRAVVEQNHPESVHLAYPGSDVQVEIYDPSPATSLQLAQSGEVVPVPTAASPSGGGRV
jgi:hypothetical protein